MTHLLWAYGLKTWIAVCALALAVIGLLYGREVRHERRGDQP